MAQAEMMLCMMRQMRMWMRVMRMMRMVAMGAESSGCCSCSAMPTDVRLHLGGGDVGNGCGVHVVGIEVGVRDCGGKRKRRDIVRLIFTFVRGRVII